MTTFEALVSVSQTLLRANGRWCADGIDTILRKDIRATVHDASRLFRHDSNAHTLVEMAVSELERRAENYSVQCPHCKEFVSLVEPMEIAS